MKTPANFAFRRAVSVVKSPEFIPARVTTMIVLTLLMVMAALPGFATSAPAQSATSAISAISATGVSERISRQHILYRSQRYLSNLPAHIEKSANPITGELEKYLDWSTDDSINIWVFFSDKGLSAPALLRGHAESRFSERAARRRRKVQREDVVFADLPVQSGYVREIVSLGARERARSRWLNAAAFTVSRTNRDLIDRISRLPFVIEIRPAVTFVRRPPTGADTQPRDLQRDALRGDPQVLQPASADLLNYGNSSDQLTQLNVQAGHQRGYNGAGVTIAMFDTGYRKSHSAFQAIIEEGRLLAEWDFVNSDSNTSQEPNDPGGSWNHGTLTWSTAGGRVDGTLFGPAYGANFLLAKTENIASETIQEEYDWVSALEWADSLGADVVSSSLAYADWYQQSDFDGATAVTTIAANMAASLGIVVCNAAANAGPSPGSLNAPADAHDILACGAVTARGVIASFSSRGPTADGRIKPDVCARGFNTFSASANGDDAFGYASGTSLSTPLVAGVTAQLIQAHPEFPPVLIMRALRETADHAQSPDNNYGWGIVNLEAALNWGVNYLVDGSSADLIVVDHPATVQFSDNSDIPATGWFWSFGDGATGTGPNPTHSYTAPGTYDIDLAIQTEYGLFNKTRNNLIVVRADTVSLQPDSAYAGHPLTVRVEMTNSQPLRFFRIPLDFSGALGLAFDSVASGARTPGFAVNVTAQDNINKTVTAQALAMDTGLPPGSGEVMVFHFTVGSTTPGGASADIRESPDGGLAIVTDEVTFPPLFSGATYTTRYVLRGDADSNNEWNIVDVTYLIGFLFDDGPPTLTIQSGDANGDLLQNLVDVIYLINYIFKGGPPPPMP